MNKSTMVENASKAISSYDPFELAKELSIEIQFTDELPSGYFGLSIPELDVIFIHNSFMDKQASYFYCAHELFHTVEDSGIQGYYNVSNLTKNRIEYSTNQKAICLLIKLFSVKFEITLLTTYQHIMSAFDIPEDLDFMVEEQLRHWAIDNIIFAGRRNK